MNTNDGRREIRLRYQSSIGLLALSFYDLDVWTMLLVIL